MSKTNQAQEVRQNPIKGNFAETVTTEVAEILSLGELKARDKQNAFAAGLLMEAVRGLLTETPESASTTVPYAKMPEIIGSLIYEAVDQNVGELMLMAFSRWSPSSMIEKVNGVQLEKNSSKLDVIFENLRAVETALQCKNASFEIFSDEIKKPRCLAFYDLFKSYALIPDIQNLAMSLAAVMIEGGFHSLTFRGEDVSFDNNRDIVYKAIIPTAIPDIMNFSPDVFRSIIARYPDIMNFSPDVFRSIIAETNS